MLKLFLSLQSQGLRLLLFYGTKEVLGRLDRRLRFVTCEIALHLVWETAFHRGWNCVTSRLSVNNCGAVFPVHRWLEIRIFTQRQNIGSLFFPVNEATTYEALRKKNTNKNCFGHLNVTVSGVTVQATPCGWSRLEKRLSHSLSQTETSLKWGIIKKTWKIILVTRSEKFVSEAFDCIAQSSSAIEVSSTLSRECKLFNHVTTGWSKMAGRS